MASRFRAAGLIAGLLMMTPALRAGEIEVRQINNFLLELSGGRGAGAWHIQYGTPSRPSEFKTLAGPGSTAYFSHYNWLRRIDTRRGVVTGRWLFPGLAISGLRWEKGHLQVEVAQAGYGNTRIRRTYDFDPDNPRLPPSNQGFADLARAEGLVSLGRVRVLQAAQAEKVLPEQENSVRRDPFAPWLRIGLGHIYAVLGRPESARAFDEGVRMESAHFAELLDISNYLERNKERDAARIAFERGYAAFWRNGQDPRLTSSLLIAGTDIQSNTPPSVQRELIERAYKTSPWIDNAAQAWELYGNSLAANGDGAAAALWLERAREARTNGLLISGDDHYDHALAASLVTSTFLAAALLYIAVLYFRYRPQRQARRAAERAAGVARPGFCHVEYWRRSERAAFLSIVAIAWIAQGVAGSSLRASSHRSFGYFFERRDGNLFSSNIIDALESRVAKSPERDLLLAISYQRDGHSEKAIKLYQGLPQAAESWNNLGVLLKNSGDAGGARQAFEQAIQLRPDFPEAEWNLGKPPRGEWVTLHEQYVPDKPMLAVPTRAQVLKAYGIRESGLDWPTVLKGPLEQDDEVNNFFQPSGRLRAGHLIFLAAGALILVFVRPREVLVSPPKLQWVSELIFPGTARVWGVFGGLLLGAACYASSALWPPGWSRLYSYMNFGNSFRRFPLPFSITRGQGAEFLSPIPSFWWLAALLTVNAAVVLFWKWRRK
jgi:tetratricopeptide (TPR) repeat protein